MNYDEFNFLEFVINSEDIGIRIDKYLASKINDISRNYIQSLINEKYIFVNNQITKSSYKLEKNDKIIVYFKNEEDFKVVPQNIPLEIIYQDSDIAVINKSVDLVVHPSPGHKENTLVNAIMHHIKDLSTINGVNRPGIVHRLDKDTSGLMVIAKNDYAHRFLAEQLKDHSMSRTYICLVKGIVETKKGIIKTLIGRDKADRLKYTVVRENGKESITEFEVVETIGEKYSLVKCHLRTGRTHQIRVHMNFIKHPIINDPLYGINNRINFKSAQLLHAYQLELTHPTTKEKMLFTSEMPEHFKIALEILKK